MTYKEAQEIISKYEDLEDKSCTCFQNPPCGKCENQPTGEDYEQALHVVEDIEATL